MEFILVILVLIRVPLLLKKRKLLFRLLNRTRNLRMMLSFKPLYFSEKELNNLTPSCSLNDMDDRFMRKLDLARSIAGIPFVLNCAYRSKDWDISKGRSGNSYHCLGKAVDIRCFSSENRYMIIYACLKVGLKVGIYKHFLHVDDRVPEIIFIGDE